MKNRGTDISRYLTKSAAVVRRAALIKKILSSVLICIGISLSVTYVAAALYRGSSSMTISVKGFDESLMGLSLSETPDFDSMIVRLNASPNEITNIAVEDLPDDLDSINGSHNGDNYFAYTFYLRNSGESTVTYNYYLKFDNIKKDLDKAIRIRVYHNGEAITYARTKSDGSGPEEGTVEFMLSNIVMDEKVTKFTPGEIDKFTVVMWIEGPDEDCKDELIGGVIKAGMYFRILDSENY